MAPPLRARPSDSLAAALACALAALPGCDSPTAYGEPDSLIIAAPDSLWAEVADTTYAVLETRLPTGRRDKRFFVTQMDPASAEAERLLLWRQVLVFGPPEDELIRRVAEAAGIEDPEPGRIFQAEDVWARGQVVTAVVLEPDDEASSWRAMIAEVGESIDERYREFVYRRMFVSGVDSVVADSLASRYGFTIRVPAVYEFAIREELDLIRLRNDNPDPSQLIRVIVLQPQPPLDTLTAAAVLAWRASVDSLYNVPQSIQAPDTTGRRLEVDGRPAVEVMGQWVDEADYPAAGPFIARAVACPERTVFLDAWLYSPDPEEGKYQYLLQLRRILDSFTCQPAGGPASGA